MSTPEEIAEDRGGKAKAFGSRRSLVFAAAAVVVVCGAGGYAIAAAVSGSGPAPSAASTALPGASGATGAGGADGGARNRPAAPTAEGVVKSVGSNSFVLTMATGGAVTVDVSTTTQYIDRSVTSPGFSDVKVNAHVSVSGTKSGSTIDATRVVLGGGRFGGFGGGVFGSGGRPVAFGIVQSASADSFVVAGRDGTDVTVEVTKSTTYRDTSSASASYSDVKKGANVVVLGTTTTSGAVSASSVLIGTFGGGGGGGGGFGGAGGFGSGGSGGSS